MLAEQIASLDGSSSDAADAARRRSPPAQPRTPRDVVMAVERARLSMQLAVQVRNKGVEAFQEIFRTQV